MNNNLNNTVEIEVKITAKDMFQFMLFHVYGKLSGIFTLSFSIICLILIPFSLTWNDQFTTIILIFGATLYLVVSPILLYVQAKRQILTNKVFKDPIHYTMTEEGLHIKQAVNSALFKWEDLVRVKQTPFNFLFYIKKDQAFILPNRLLDEEKKITIRELTNTK